VTGRTGGDGHELLDVVARALALGLDVATLEIGNHALEALLLPTGAVLRPALEDDLFARPVEKGLLDIVVELLERRIERDVEVSCNGVEPSLIVRSRVAPRLEHLAERLAGVLDHELFVDLLRLADPLTLRAGPVRTVERERAGLDLGDVDAAVGARECLGEL